MVMVIVMPMVIIMIFWWSSLVHLVPHRLQLTRERFLNFRTLQNRCLHLDTNTPLLTSLSWLVSRWFCSVSWVISRLFSFSADLCDVSVWSSKARKPYTSRVYMLCKIYLTKLLSHHFDFAASCNISWAIVLHKRVTLKLTVISLCNSETLSSYSSSATSSRRRRWYFSCSNSCGMSLRCHKHISHNNILTA